MLSPCSVKLPDQVVGFPYKCSVYSSSKPHHPPQGIPLLLFVSSTGDLALFSITLF
jgi:hypothetical protein